MSIIKPTRGNYLRYRFPRQLVDTEGFSIVEAILLTDLAINIKGIKNYRKENAGWYFCTGEDLQARHPYLSLKTIRRTLDKLRADGVLLADGKRNKRRYDRTLWYSFKDKDLLKTAACDEDCITYVAQDAIDFDVPTAIILSNIKYWAQHYGNDAGWFQANPSDYCDDNIINLPLKIHGVRRSFKRLVAAGRLERKTIIKCRLDIDKQGRTGFGGYLYRLAEVNNINVCLDLRNEAYEIRTPVEPTEVYEKAA